MTTREFRQAGKVDLQEESTHVMGRVSPRARSHRCPLDTLAEFAPCEDIRNAKSLLMRESLPFVIDPKMTELGGLAKISPLRFLCMPSLGLVEKTRAPWLILGVACDIK
ncbi:MAG: hypothetical protein FJ303_06475 [Planctomycetes bacterium]|nr:hypothetical protein [Planctomycetota bacterium]